MAQNKNALLRYRTIDRCLRNTSRKWTLDDLVDACSDALYEYEGRDELVSVRTVQRDLEMMRSDKLGYEAPIEVYDRKYYRYSDSDYSIHTRPLSQHDIDSLNRTIDLLRQFDEFDPFHEMAEVVSRLQDKVASAERRRPIVDFERNGNLKGLQLLNPLYDAIAKRTTINVSYRSFAARTPAEFIIFPHLLKEYRNRWFVFGSRAGDMKLFNLALDRIVEFHECPDIPYRDNPDFTENYFDDIVGVTKLERTKKTKVIIWADNREASYILTKPLHPSQRLMSKNKGDGSMNFELELMVNPEFIRLLMGYGPGIVVLSPRSLADKLSKAFESAASNYRSVVKK